MQTAKPTFLDLSAPDFSTRGPDVIAARENHWCARTPFGLAVLRYREAGVLLRDRRLRQGSHAWPKFMGLEGSFAQFWTQSVISQEGDMHKRLRAVAVPALSKDFISSLVPAFDDIARDLTDQIVDAGQVDFMEAFATPFAGRAITTLLAINDENWPQVSGDASALGLAMGVDAKMHEPNFNAACDRLMALANDLILRARRGDDTSGYVGRLVKIVDEKCEISDEELQNLVVISIFGGVDTTRSQLGLLVSLFIANPDQWQKLRQNPDLAAATLEEGIRHRPTTTWATRQAMETFDFQGITVEKGDAVHILVHASALDTAISEHQNFDITAARKTHFGFGGGAHTCLGQAVARADIASALRAMAARIDNFTYSGKPTWHPDSGNTSAITLPVLVTPDLR